MDGATVMKLALVSHKQLINSVNKNNEDKDLKGVSKMFDKFVEFMNCFSYL